MDMMSLFGAGGTMGFSKPRPPGGFNYYGNANAIDPVPGPSSGTFVNDFFCLILVGCGWVCFSIT